MREKKEEKKKRKKKETEKKKKRESEMATGIRPYQYEPVADISFGIDWGSSSDE